MWYYKPEIRVVIIWLFLHQFWRHIKWSSLQELKQVRYEVQSVFLLQ